ncbi:hypothetical protein D3C80_1814880 [compost metagenome]
MHAAHGKQCRRLRGEDQHLQWQGHGLEAGQHLKAIELGDADVENHQVRQGFANHLHGIHAIVRFAHDFVILVFQQHADGQADNGMVIDDKYGVHIELP